MNEIATSGFCPVVDGLVGDINLLSHLANDANRQCEGFPANQAELT